MRTHFFMKIRLKNFLNVLLYMVLNGKNKTVFICFLKIDLKETEMGLFLSLLNGKNIFVLVRYQKNRYKTLWVGGFDVGNLLF